MRVSVDKKLNLINEQVRNLALRIIEGLPLEPVHSVRICEHKPDRSLEQNALMWVWLGHMSDDIGHTKDELHVEFKRKYCLPIMLAHPDDYPEIASAWARLTRLSTEGEVADALAPIISTKRLKVRHMSQYLKDIFGEAQGLSIRLPDPRDRGQRNF